MALDSALIWGKATADAIKAIGVDNSADITDAQLEAVWAAIKGVTITNLGKSDVASGAFTAGITPVTGVGGPVT